MSYQVLARKWRPQNFKQMVGQEHVLKALIHALESQRLHHAYLFTGTRGVGKTTIGRILAKCLSCHTGITAEPCGECGACTNITEGRYVDLIEIDAASRTKVEDMRELLDNVQYAPSEGRFKIYLIDEVHMLSQSSFNALLKTLEEPPEHVKFLFATTDPQKLPVTILSRCLQFNLKNMSPERIVTHLQNILGQESVQFEDPALWALARAADGSMRDALSLTDQAIAYGNHCLTEQGVSAMLGTVDQKKIYRIIDCLLQHNAAQMLVEVQALSEFSPNYASVLASISEVLHRVAIEQAVPGATDNSMGDRENVVHYAANICAEDVQLFYQVALVSRQDLSITPDPRAGLEMALLRMLAFKTSPTAEAHKSELNNTSSDAQLGPSDSAIAAVPESDIDSTVSHASVNEAPTVSQPEVADQDDFKKKTEVNGASSPSDSEDQSADSNVEARVDSRLESTVLANSAPQSSSNPLNSSSPVPEEKSSVHKGDAAEGDATQDSIPQSAAMHEIASGDSVLQAVPQNVDLGIAQFSDNSSQVIDSTAVAAKDVQEDSVNKTQSEEGVPESLSGAENSVSVLQEQVIESEGWNKEVSSLGLSGMTLNLILNSVLEKESGKLALCFETGHYRLLNASHEKRIREALSSHYGSDKVIELLDGLKSGQETPMMWRERMRAELDVQARQNINSDPFILQMIKEFDGKLIEESIKPLTQVR